MISVLIAVVLLGGFAALPAVVWYFTPGPGVHSARPRLLPLLRDPEWTGPKHMWTPDPTPAQATAPAARVARHAKASLA